MTALSREQHASLIEATSNALTAIERADFFAAAVRPASERTELEVFVVYPDQDDAVSALRRAAADALISLVFATKDGDDPQVTARALEPYGAHDVRLLAVRYDAARCATVVGALHLIGPGAARMPYSLRAIATEWGKDVADTVARTRLPDGSSLPLSLLEGQGVFDIPLACVRNGVRDASASADERALHALYSASLRIIKAMGGRFLVGAMDVENIYEPLRRRGPEVWAEFHGIERKRIMSRIPGSNVSTAAIGDVQKWEVSTRATRKILHGLLWGDALARRGVTITGVRQSRLPLFEVMPCSERLAPARLSALPHETPFLYLDLDEVGRRHASFQHELPEAQVHYAMKCNPDRRLLTYLHERKCRFEIASWPELQQLLAIGVDAREVLFSNPVRGPMHTRRSAQAGVYRFAFDSGAELDSLAEHAPGASVYVRLATAAGSSKVGSEGKFGVDVAAATELMCRAASRGLVPYGVTFHVGSQVEQPSVWKAAIRKAGALLRQLEQVGLRLTMLDLGGGFPAFHRRSLPSLAEYARAIRASLAAELPYRPPELVIEPGRGLVSDAGVMVATVIGVARRGMATWVHLDLGGFTMLEALETGHTLDYPIADSRGSRTRMRGHITAATCDSMDTIVFDDESLSADLTCGDRVFIYAAGAYTTSYASTFNGFAAPQVVHAAKRDAHPSHDPGSHTPCALASARAHVAREDALAAD